jgi:hypothetical protein
MAVSRAILGVLGALLVPAMAATAQANGRVPAAGQIVLPRPGTGLPASEILLRTTFGVALSKDSGTTWDWICEPALGFDGVQDPTFGAVRGADGKGAYVYSAFEGLGRATEEFCSPAVDRAFGGAIDLVVDPADSTHVVAVASKYDRTGDDGTLYYTNKLAVSRDGGSAYTTLALAPVFDATFRFETVELAASDPKRLYTSGFRGLGPTGTALIAHSEDGGITFAETAIPLIGDERGVYLATVDPKNADVVYARTAGTPDTKSRLLVSRDGGKTFAVKATLQGPMLGFALTPDGAGLYLGGPKDRLLFATPALGDEAWPLEKRSNTQIQCLTTDGTTLWACSNEVSGFVVGTSEDGGRTFARKLGLSTLRGPLACPAGTPTAVCPDYWARQAADLGISLAADAGAAADGGTPLRDAGPKGGGADDLGGSGCAAASGAPAWAPIGGAVGFFAMIAALFARRRR